MRLHRALEGERDATAPPEWVISRIAEEFSTDPLRALWLMDHAPLGLIETILDLRAYAETYSAIRGARGDAKTQERLYETPAGKLVLEIEAEMAAAQIAARRARQADGE